MITRCLISDFAAVYQSEYKNWIYNNVSQNFEVTILVDPKGDKEGAKRLEKEFDENILTMMRKKKKNSLNYLQNNPGQSFLQYNGILQKRQYHDQSLIVSAVLHR